MSQPLFGLVPAGQPAIITPTEAPSPTSFLYAIPPSNPNAGGGGGASKPFGHVVVFMLPGVVLPPGTAAAIYLVTPPSPGQTTPNFKFLGGIGPGKESAIFKVGPGSAGTGTGENLVIGVSVEDAESVASRMSSSGTGSAATTGNGTATEGALVPVRQVQQPSTLVLAQRIIKNAFNFLSSFTGGGSSGQMEVVPLKAFEEWWKKFESKVRTDPGFLERDEDQ